MGCEASDAGKRDFFPVAFDENCGSVFAERFCLLRFGGTWRASQADGHIDAEADGQIGAEADGDRSSNTLATLAFTRLL